MKVDVVVKGYKIAQLGGPQPRNDIPTHRQEYESHVEFKSLSGAFSRKNTVAHDLEGILLFVLEELPREKPNHNQNPQGNNPKSPPILFEIIKHFFTSPSYWASLSKAL